MPTEGMAEAYYGLGEALSGRGRLAAGAMFLQHAIHLSGTPLCARYPGQCTRPRSTTSARSRPMIVFRRARRSQSSIDIRKAINLNLLERVDEAQSCWSAPHGNPQDLMPLETLGSIMRAHKRYEEAVSYYTRAIALIGQARERALVLLLCPRHQPRAVEEVDASRSRSAEALSSRRISLWCSTISAIPGSIRAGTSSRAWR